MQVVGSVVRFRFAQNPPSPITHWPETGTLQRYSLLDSTAEMHRVNRSFQGTNHKGGSILRAANFKKFFLFSS